MQPLQVQSILPKPGTTISQRLNELSTTNFVQVRFLAYSTYTKPDGTPLMSFKDTLHDRELVKRVIVEHELSLGQLIDDGTLLAIPPPQEDPALRIPSHPSQVPTIPTTEVPTSSSPPPIPAKRGRGRPPKNPPAGTLRPVVTRSQPGINPSVPVNMSPVNNEHFSVQNTEQFEGISVTPPPPLPFVPRPHRNQEVHNPMATEKIEAELRDLKLLVTDLLKIVRRQELALHHIYLATASSDAPDTIERFSEYLEGWRNPKQ